MAHTEGEWIVGGIQGDGDYRVIYGKNGTYHATAIFTGNAEETDANAHLIAAAPELLDICKKMLEAINGSTAQVMATAGRMQAIVAKAEGK